MRCLKHDCDFVSEGAPHGVTKYYCPRCAQEGPLMEMSFDLEKVNFQSLANACRIAKPFMESIIDKSEDGSFEFSKIIDALDAIDGTQSLAPIVEIIDPTINVCPDCGAPARYNAPCSCKHPFRR